MRQMTISLFAAGLLMVSAAALAADAPAGVGSSAKGKVLVDAKGMTLYTFDKDAGGKSACNGPCANNWPPLLATTGMASGEWSMITRDDGSKQWAYKGKPVYRWSKDSKPGDITGDGFLNGAWHIAQP